MICFSGTQNELSALQAAYRDKIPMAERSAERRFAIKALGAEFFQKCCGILESVEFCADAMDWSFRCQKMCRLLPLFSANSVWLEIGGNTCTPWSSAGAGLGWLDPCSLPSLAWGHWLHGSQPRYIINECTPAWPAVSFFDRMLPGLYRLGTINVSPEDLGIPARRPRLYTAASAIGKTVGIALHDRLFMSVLRRDVLLHAAAFFCAPERVQHQRLQKMLEQRGLFPPSTGLAGLDWRVALTFSARQRLKDYKASYKQSGGTKGFLCNITQNFGFVERLNSIMPTLLKNSMVFNIHSNRLLCSPEFFCVNGVPLFAPVDDDLKLVPEEIFCEMPYNSARQLAGNMMSIPVVGSVIGMLLLCSLAQPSPGTAEKGVDMVAQAAQE